MIRSLAHVCLVVPDLEQAAEQLLRQYGLVMGERLVNTAQGARLAYVDLGNAKLEIIEPHGESPALRRFLARNPLGGLHHFALGVDSIQGARESLSGGGVQLAGSADARDVHGEPIAFVHPRSFLGALVELQQEG
jgi:methylmalonyl-CoA/ethylmalonyl-CoA epimerase